MSQENVETVHAAVDALNRGDVDAALKDAAPDFELDQSRALGPNRGVFGLDDVRRVWYEFIETWEAFQIGANELIDAGDHVVMPFTSDFRGREGVEVQARGVWVWTIRDDAIMRVCLYQERNEALEAAGLSE
jgi:ketosteroid isomerase-like protein